MRIEDYPRPHADSGIGFYYFPDSDHFGRADLDRWVPRLEALGASWLVMQTPPSRPIPDSFLQRLMVADIEPVVMISPARFGPMEAGVLRDTIRSMVDSGAHYMVLFDRPNDRPGWAPHEWNKPALVERFVDFLVPALELAAGEGAIPVLPPLEPLGAYWDTAFLEAMLSSLGRRGLGSVLESAAVGMRNFANNRPLDWGKGGREAWPRATPYAKQPDGQDHRGFCMFEWYQSIIRQETGRTLPLIGCANGPQASQMTGGRFDPATHASRMAEMVRMMIAGDLPSTVFNHAFWLLAAERHQPCYYESWYDADGTARLPAVEALEELSKGARPARAGLDSAVQAVPLPTSHRMAPRGPQRATGGRQAATRRSHSPAPEGNGRKVIDHYLLLPLFEWGVARWHLSIVQQYVEAFLPTCGFSVDEAKQARKVTIIGNEQGVSQSDAQALTAAGCQVQRIAGKDGRETRLLLQELARNKQLTYQD
ncbi:MAG: hypothetical protein KAS81_04200 [Anaerolineales bacterium]|nr:hypothetical protein [Anaerolineales bacterium]